MFDYRKRIKRELLRRLAPMSGNLPSGEPYLMYHDYASNNSATRAVYVYGCHRCARMGRNVPFSRDSALSLVLVQCPVCRKEWRARNNLPEYSGYLPLFHTGEIEYDANV